MCFVRAARGGEIVLTSWGRSSGFCVDPIEKKPLNHFLPGSAVLSFGTAGCNLACKFCQNWDISKSREIDTLGDSATPDVIAGAAERLGCRSVACTYNDPVIFLEYAVDVAAACRRRDLRVVGVTAGYVTEAARRDFFSAFDAVNVDLKAFSNRFYERLCAAQLQPVLDALVWVRRETDVWLEVTTMLIPGENDSEAELSAMASWFVEQLGPDVPWHFTAFHPDWRMLGKPPTPRATLLEARRIALEAGCRYVYTGNVRGELEQSTFCHECGELVVGRDGYSITAWGLGRSGNCLRCGATCPGLFEGAPGNWGARRLPVRLADTAC
jgi:pyruvate formate lyase activating enzyme